MKPEDAIARLNDAIRYTVCFEPASYSDGYWDVKHRLESREYRMIYSKNHWADDPEYKGINTRWVTPGGQRFELQFHTAESFLRQGGRHPRALRAAAQPAHQGRTSAANSRRSSGKCASWITVPEGIRDIPDHRRKGHG